MATLRHFALPLLLILAAVIQGVRLLDSVAQIQSWSCSLGLVLAFLQDQYQEQDRVFLARPRPRLTVQDLSKNKT
ncbi:jg23614 [Pararge aegeria aegeria]|uniref:Jg23614 protein n=1 Tax=Pararge aegeria aegeria TaxID=348720 RepID=A0A8S4SJ59_9NEOP|nr:jg23614 [Pararge aegeria aegeria]